MQPVGAAADLVAGHEFDLHAPLDDRHAEVEFDLRVPVVEWRVEVEFVARYKVGGRAYRLHETSRFERDEQGFWRYVDGEVSER